MAAKQPKYLSYLLRLWREEGVRKPGWRMMVLNPHTGECWGFPEVEQLTIFLNDQIHEFESQKGKGFQHQGGQNDHSDRN